MYIKLSLCFTALSLVTVVGNCAPVASEPAKCWNVLPAIVKDIGELQRTLTNNEVSLPMPNSTGSSCARATIKSFKKAFNLIERNVSNDTVKTTTQNILQNIKSAWEGIEKENEEQETQQLTLGVALGEMKTFFQRCCRTQRNN